MSTKPVLNPERVNVIFCNCLFGVRENWNNAIEARDIGVTVMFHSDRLNSYKAEIKTMLDELPFVTGGMSIADAHKDKHGRPWTTTHPRLYQVNQLLELGIALGEVKPWRPQAHLGVEPEPSEARYSRCL